MNLSFEAVTQSEYIERATGDWKKSSISKNFNKLAENHALLKFVDKNNMSIKYIVNPDLLINTSSKEELDIKINEDEFAELWSFIVEIPLSSNELRILIELILHGETSISELSRRKGWKISGISKSMKSLFNRGLVDCNVKETYRVFSLNRQELEKKIGRKEK